MIKTNFVSTYSIDFNKSKFVDGDFTQSSSWSFLIQEGDGFFKNELQHMKFEYLGVEIDVMFDLIVSGSYSYDCGDYLTPPYEDCEINDVDITINSLTIDEYQVDLTTEIVEIMKSLIKINL